MIPSANPTLRPRAGHRPRKGGAFLLLIVALLVVIVGATQAMLMGEIRSQQNERQRSKTNALIRAMEIAQSIDHDWETSVELPIAQSAKQTSPAKQSIQISTNADKSILKASWVVEDRTVASIVRPMANSNEDTGDKSVAEKKPDTSVSKSEK